VESVLVISTNISTIKRAEEDLALQKQLLETVTQNTAHGLFMMDGEDRTIYMNEAAEQMTGFRFEELKGKVLHDAVHHTRPDGRHFPIHECPIGQALAAQNRVNGEEVFVTKDNKFFPVAYTASPIIVDGKSIGTVIEIRDTTEEKKREQQLRESEESFRNFSNSIQNLAWIAKSNGAIYWSNQRWFDYTGLRSEEMSELEWRQVHHPDHYDKVMNIITNAWDKGEPWEMTIPLKGKDGAYRWFLTRAVPIKDNDGNVTRWIGTNTDINEQVEAEKALRQSEEQLQLLSDFMPQIVWATDALGYHDFYNKLWYEFTGLSYEESKNTGWDSVLHPDDLDKAWKVWKHSLDTGEPYEVEYRMRRVDGEYRWLLARAKPYKNAEGTIVRWFGTCTDIHDQKTFYETLEKLVAERTKELQRSNEDLQQFAHVTSHDLKEPVRKIKTFISRIMHDFADELPEKAKKYLAKMDKASNRMYTMIDGVLHYSSMNSLEEDVEPIDLNAVMQQVESDLEMVIAQKEATVKYGNLPTVEGSDVLLHQLFYNLVNNSLKFSNKNVPPRITVSSEIITRFVDGKDGGETAEYARIKVADNGIGFDQSYAESIFKTFYRLHSKDIYEGSGLGLAFCKKITERHGGTIEAIGEEGKGATIIVTLPLSVQFVNADV